MIGKGLLSGGCVPFASGLPGNRWMEVRRELERVTYASPFEIACAIVDYQAAIRSLQWRLNNAASS